MLNKIFFGLKIIDIEVKLDTRNFIKISRVEIIKPGLVKKWSYESRISKFVFRITKRALWASKRFGKAQFYYRRKPEKVVMGTKSV